MNKKTGQKEGTALTSVERYDPSKASKRVVRATAITAIALALIWAFGPRPRGFEPIAEIATTVLVVIQFGYFVAGLWALIAVGWLFVALTAAFFAQEER
jgi:hypothetical protein